MRLQVSFLKIGTFKIGLELSSIFVKCVNFNFLILVKAFTTHLKNREVC